MTTYSPGFTAARAVNAHPWLDATYPEPDETELLITPPWPALHQDQSGSYIEGCITWRDATAGGVHEFTVELVYEGPDGDLRDEFTLPVDAGPMAWLELARPIAESLHGLHAQVHTTEAA